MNLQVLHEDNHTIVVNKRPGEIVQGDKTGDIPLSDKIKEYLKEKYDKPGNVFCGVVHRIDRPTSGVLVFARTSKALARLNDQFREKSTKKIYWAIVEKKPPKREGKLIDYLKKNEKQNKSYAVKEGTQGSKLAILKYTYLSSSDNYHLLEIELETGRHHQIRCQLANIGCWIKGDVKYGAKRSNRDLSIHLHSKELSFDHPTTKERLNFTARCPDDPVWSFFEKKLL